MNARNDFDGDGRSDILWRDNDTGALRSWLGQASGGFVINPSVSGQVSTDWFVASIGDFNGDDRADVLWRNGMGTVVSWLGQDGGGFVHNTGVSGQVPTNWYVARTGDFNGDGNDDVLWRKDTGEMVSWLGQDSGGFVNNPGVSGQAPANWFVAGTGDFNGDGNDDLLWRNLDTGALQSWLGQDSGGFVNNPSVSGQLPTNWFMTGTGDFNGDGNDDLLWRNASSGALVSWLGQDSGGFVNNPGVSGQLPSNWFVASTGDFNGDDNDDILWRNNDTGAVMSWLGQDGGGFVNNPGVSGHVDLSWHVQPSGGGGFSWWDY